jgi:hypothetical protein
MGKRACQPTRGRLTTLLASAALVLGPIAGLGMTAGPAAALTCPPGTTAWEQTHYGELSGGGGEQPSVTTANNWGGGSACLTVPGSSYTYDAAFTVAQSRQLHRERAVRPGQQRRLRGRLLHVQ